MTNPWLQRRMLDFAHQGGALEAPSSTLYAIEKAIVSGADVIELDVHATKDGVLVVCHDPTVDRTTNGTGVIADLYIAEIEALDNAYYFVDGKDAITDAPEQDYVFRGRAPRERRFAVARLEEILVAFPDVFLNLDIKRSEPDVVPYESRLAQMLRKFSRGDDVIVASFNDRSTEIFSTFAPEVGTALGTNALTRFIQAVRADAEPAELDGEYVALQMPSRYAGVNLVDDKLVAAAHEQGLALHVWTIDEEVEMKELIALGVDGIMTNRPAVLGALLRDAGRNYRR